MHRTSTKLIKISKGIVGVIHVVFNKLGNISLKKPEARPGLCTLDRSHVFILFNLLWSHFLFLFTDCTLHIKCYNYW